MNETDRNQQDPKSNFGRSRSLRNLTYSESLVTFVDILGFKNLVDTEDKAPAVDGVLQIFSEAFSATEHDEILCRQTTTFSDNLVTSIPLMMPDGTPQIHGTLFHELFAVALAQAELFDRRGLFARGAITVGNLFHTTDRVFGPALVEAAELEKSTCYPRVCIPRSVFERYKKDRAMVAHQHQTHPDDFEYIEPLIRKDSDGTIHVDYLRAAQGNFDDPHYFPEFMLKHAKAIQRGMNHGEEKVKKKYHWLGTYHNSTVDLWPTWDALAESRVAFQ